MVTEEKQQLKKYSSFLPFFLSAFWGSFEYGTGREGVFSGALLDV
jgi:hypothetical protein